MNFNFYLFGAPLSLDLHPFDAKLINYFQLFDNGSKEKVKLSVHRMASGEISYTYLRYHLLSNGGKAGGFFGMSVVFKDEYCKDVEALYQLFDLVYENILANKILLKALEENSDSLQAKYLVNKFVEAESEVKRIEAMIRKNVETHFADDMCSITQLPPVKPENAGLTKILNDTNANATFEAALRKQAWVSIVSVGEPINPAPPKVEKKRNVGYRISKELIIALIMSSTMVALVSFLFLNRTPNSSSQGLEPASPHTVQQPSKPVTMQETLPKAVASEKETQAEDEKQVAINQLRESAKNVFENSGKGSITKIEGYKSAITLLQGLKSLGADEQFKNDSAKYAKQTITYYSNEMEKANQDNSKKKYANYILEIDSKNKEALKVKNPSSSTTLKVSEKPKDTTPPTIHVKKGNQALTTNNGVITIQVGDVIELTAKQGNVNCSIGEWSWSNNKDNIELSGKDKNPVTLKAVAGTKDGPVKLTYKDKQTGKEWSIQIRIM